MPRVNRRQARRQLAALRHCKKNARRRKHQHVKIACQRNHDSYRDHHRPARAKKTRRRIRQRTLRRSQLRQRTDGHHLDQYVEHHHDGHPCQQRHRQIAARFPRLSRWNHRHLESRERVHQQHYRLRKRPVVRHYRQRESCRLEKEKPRPHEHRQRNQLSGREQVAGVGRHPHSRNIHRRQHSHHNRQNARSAASRREDGEEQPQVRRQQGAIRRK